MLCNFAAGVTSPALQSIVTHWVQEHQRSRAISFIFSGDCRLCALACKVALPCMTIPQNRPETTWYCAGCTLGTVTAYASAPFIANRWGWEYVYLVCGLAGFAWIMLWAGLVVDKPHAVNSPPPSLPLTKGEAVPVPWLAFATCLPLWAIIVIETSHGA